eukprot:CAMPEP_0184643622 /NCGR_PEP_ID=MMETSP0308-20130426/452_1 /TAXON_ID=38269 /ORGANISM="Gloeochaete witrockiana, Strain SAG 46.84" /LENGTH=219 /DNA_ID=CAMNT_0027071667 /DNA_START=105 /DNA_END=764 /DNA_ORIENTATION=-
MSSVAVCFGSICCPGQPSKKKLAETWSLTGPESVEPGSDVSMTWKLPDTELNANGYIGLYDTTQTDKEYIDYQPFEGKEGVIAFSSKRLVVGKEYEARIFFVDPLTANKSGSLKGRSAPFVLGSWLVGVPPRIDQGAEIIVQYSAPTNFGSAWVGVYRASASDDDCLQWSWVKASEGSLQFKAAGMKPDYAYESRIYQDDGKTGYSFKARSGLFVVMPR